MLSRLYYIQKQYFAMLLASLYQTNVSALVKDNNSVKKMCLFARLHLVFL